MKTLPSKELLSAVYGREIENVHEHEGKIYYSFCDNGMGKYSSPLVIASNVKIWAFTQEYTIKSSLFHDVLCSSIGGVAEVVGCNIQIKAGAEHEAVTLCGEWILKEISK